MTELGAIAATVDVVDCAVPRCSVCVEPFAIHADLAVEDELRNGFRSAIDALGGLDILINNVGIGDPIVLDGHTQHSLEAQLRINLTSHILASQIAFRHMKPGGSIVNIGSVAASVGGVLSQRGTGEVARSGVAYVAAKGSTVSITRWLAAEGAPLGIRANAVLPGPIATDGVAHLRYDLEQIPLKRMGSPAEAAAVIIFFASDASSFVTGQSLNVDGGMRFD